MTELDLKDFNELMLKKDVTFICASDRLWRSLEHRYNSVMASANKKAWINQFDAYYLPQYLSKLADQSLDSTVVLTSLQEVVACKRAIDTVNNIDHQELSTIGLAKRFREAINISNNYFISQDRDYYRLSHEASRFAEWSDYLDGYASRESFHFVTKQNERLLDDIKINPNLDIKGTVCFVGFVEFTPFVNEMIASLKERGSSVCSIEFPNNKTSNAVFAHCQDEHSESRMAALWLRKKIKENSNGQYALVVPEIDRYRDVVDSALEEVFELSFHDKYKPWVFAGGRQLSEYPMVADAMDILSILNGGDSEQWSRVILSPFINGFEEERSIRSKLDLAVRALPKRKVFIKDVLRLANNLVSESIFNFNLKAFNSFVESLPDTMDTSHWTVAMDAALKAIGWLQGRTLTSREHQTQAAFYKQLSTFTSLDQQVGKVRHGAAFGWLREIINSKRFEAEVSQKTPIVIVSHWDSMCCQFDAAWVLGVNSSELPRSSSATAFLPLELQEKAGVPSANMDVHMNIAMKQAEYLKQVGGETVISYSKTLKGIESGYSPLMPELATSDLLDVNLPSLSRVFKMVEFADPIPSATVSEIDSLKGIVSIVSDQAQGSIVSFLKHRLNVKEFPVSDIGMKSFISGILMQAALEYFWNEVKDQKTLKSTGPGRRSDLVNASLAHAVKANNRVVRDVPDSAVGLEVKRLHKIIMDWLVVEENRKLPFEVIANEAPASIELAGREFKLSIDRIDRVTDGDSTKIVYMDHKTGVAVNGQKMLPCSMSLPQLPIYLLSNAGTELSNPDGLFLAQIRPETKRFVGGAGFDAQLSSRPFAPQTESQWQDLKSDWAVSLEKLTDDFVEGRVSPLNDLATYNEYLKPLLVG